MGLDGGTVVSRSDVLRGQSWRVAQADTSRSTRGGCITGPIAHQGLDKAAEREVKWSVCSLSSDVLHAPVVADGLGSLYNKAAVIEYLLAKRGTYADQTSLQKYYNQQRVGGAALEHLTSLRDVFEVRLTPDRTAQGSGTLPTFVCPITNLPCQHHPCSALRPCGHVLSDRALVNLRCTSCPVCEARFESTVPINGTPEQVAALHIKLAANAAAAAANTKKGSKRRAEAQLPHDA